MSDLNNTQMDISNSQNDKKNNSSIEIESLLSKIAIDYYLWTDTKSPKYQSNTSSISMTTEEELDEILDNKKFRENRITKVKNNCPKIRRPDDDDKCNNPIFPFLKINKKGFKCCYKKQSKK